MSTAPVIDPHVSIELRPYQRECLTAIEAAALRGALGRHQGVAHQPGVRRIARELAVEVTARRLVASRIDLEGHDRPSLCESSGDVQGRDADGSAHLDRAPRAVR